ncbi:MAG: reverse transcriptase-like protein [Sporolactobacillus sp.]
MISASFDGAASGNPGIAGAGLSIHFTDGKVMNFHFPLGTLSSNHEAEFAALLAALNYCFSHGYTSASFRTDSKLVADALEKRFVKNRIYAGYLTEALALIDQFSLFFCKWIPDVQNKTADQLARQAIHAQQFHTIEE